MVDHLKFYIDGAWRSPASKKTRPVVNPATEEVLYEIALGSEEDVDKAVAAARRAFETYSLTTREQRVELLGKIIEVYKGRMKDIGAAISAHAGIDMMSCAGSTRAGIDVVQRAAPTVKRVTQELGGKSPNIILEDADLSKSIAGGTAHCFNNTGQSCNAPTRMLVPLAEMKEAGAIAEGRAEKPEGG